MTNETVEPARWGEPVTETDLAAAETRLGARLPEAWRRYLQRDAWLRKGRLDAWGEATPRHPGIYLLGTDGSRNLSCIDLRDAEPAVQVTDIASSGWRDMEPLLESVDAFVDAISEGTFTAYPNG